MIPMLTVRLSIDFFGEQDASFILGLLNSRGWLDNIGYRGVDDLTAAANYIRQKLTVDNERGFGCFAIRQQAGREAVGLLSLLQRDYLDAPDIGYALMPQYFGKGYAYEAAVALLQHCRELGLGKVYAIITPGNEASERLLNKLGFRFQRRIDLPNDQVHCFECMLA